MGANFQIMVNNIIEKFDRVRKSREGKRVLATMVDISQLLLNMGANLQIIVNDIIEHSIEFAKCRERQENIVAAKSPSLRGEATTVFNSGIAQ